jgi:endogenous inhibitor of DNA gyrase (YacG/DUF329 family)
MRCPICKKELEPGGPYAPFCSDRCRLFDLANWATEKYRFPAPDEPQPEIEDEESEEG